MLEPDFLVHEPQQKVPYKHIFRTIVGSITTIIGFLFAVTAFAIRSGKLLDRFTNNAFTNTDDIFPFIEESMGTEAGMGLSALLITLFSIVILIGPLDYYAGYNAFTLEPTIGGSMDLLIFILLIYAIASIMIGFVMRRYHPIGGFFLGFFTIVTLNATVYLFLYYADYTFALFAPQLVANTQDISSLVQSILAGIYGESPSQFLIRGALINGTVLGIFGSFTTACFMPSRKRNAEVLVECKDDDLMCLMPLEVKMPDN